MSADEISEIARDSTIGSARRRKAQAEEKERGIRNRQKRRRQ
jgi:hypothetical protein